MVESGREYRNKKVRERVMASEPLFEEQSDAAKVSETPYPTNGSGKNLAKVARFKYSNLCTHMPISPSKARHFPQCSGEADTKEERIHNFA